MNARWRPSRFAVLALAIAAFVKPHAVTPAVAQPTFTERVLSASAPQPTSVVAADVDGDGDNDVVAAEYSADLVTWYENSGATPPTWTKRAVGAASGPITVAVGDVDRDGDLDVFSSNFNNEGVAWYENHPGPPRTWTKRVISAFWVGAWGVGAADIDGDGDIDGIGGLTNTKCGPPIHCVGVEWYDNDGAVPPNFTIRPISSGLVGASSVDAADLDGDGDLDVLSVDTGGDRVFWYENDGAHPPVWTGRVIATTTDDPWSVFHADLDRDGDVDVLVASAEDDRIWWFENDGAAPPGWTAHTLATGRDGAISVYARDLDGDGDADVIAGSWNDSTISWYENDGNSPVSFTEHFIAICGGPEGITAAPIDGDADVDVVCAANPGNKVHLYENNANFAETDGDGVRDDLDCSPEDPTAFALPGEIRGVRFQSESELRFTPAGPSSGTGAVHDVMRGPLEALPTGSISGETCLGDGIVEASVVDATVPAVGTGSYYLVRGTNACDVGSYGSASSGTPRATTACP